MKHILLIDNFDSFTYNLVDFFETAGQRSLFCGTMSRFLKSTRSNTIFFSSLLGLQFPKMREILWK
jgi:anthranilate/para-aminobenzoate synthase component II